MLFIFFVMTDAYFSLITYCGKLQLPSTVLAIMLQLLCHISWQCTYISTHNRYVVISMNYFLLRHCILNYVFIEYMSAMYSLLDLRFGSIVDEHYHEQHIPLNHTHTLPHTICNLWH